MPIFLHQLLSLYPNSNFMRKTFFLLLMVMVVTAHAQTATISKVRLADIQLKDSTIQKKWFVSKYSDISAGFMAFKGGSATVFSAPVGIQLNRKLNNNLYAFAGVEVAPSYITFNQRFVNTNFSKTGFTNTFMAANRSQFSINPAAFVGLGYTNNSRSFQIEARMSIQNSNSNYFTDPTDFRNFINMDRQVRGFNPRNN